MKKLPVFILVLASFIYSTYEWGIYAYNSRTSNYDIEYYSSLCKDKNNYNNADARTLEDWICRNSLYNASKKEWLIILLLNIVTFILLIILTKKEEFIPAEDSVQRLKKIND